MLIDTKVYPDNRLDTFCLEVSVLITTSDRTPVFSSVVGNFVVDPRSREVTYYRWTTRIGSAQTLAEVAGEDLKIAHLYTALCAYGAADFGHMLAWLRGSLPRDGVGLDWLTAQIKANARTAQRQAA